MAASTLREKDTRFQRVCLKLVIFDANHVFWKKDAQNHSDIVLEQNYEINLKPERKLYILG